jgi:hypothetical protein
VSPAAAESEQAAAANTVAGRLLTAPRAEALVKRLPVRVALRVPARTTRLRVRVGGRNVTSRFRRRGGSLRVANLTRGDGLRYGRNHLVVLAERRGGRHVMEARSFASHPYLYDQSYAPAGTSLPRGVEVSGLGPIGVSITGKTSTEGPPEQDGWIYDHATGTRTGFPDSSATNWELDTNSYQVQLHCTSNRFHANRWQLRPNPGPTG